MSSEADDFNNLNDPGRRKIIRAAGAVTLAGVAGSALAMASPAFSQNAPNTNRGTKGYWIARIDVHNPDAYKAYASANGAALLRALQAPAG